MEAPRLACWITLAGVLLLLGPAQCRRARHAPWVSSSSSSAAVRCARCPPGWGVERRCVGGVGGREGQYRDTACTPCREGETFSAHHSARAACLLCSRCGAGLFVAKECTLTHDTVCAACHPPPPLHRRNEDYALRCSRNVPREDDDEYVLGDAPADDRQDGPGHHVHGGLASYGLSQSSLPPRSKSDMARSILADPGAVEKTSLATGASTASTTRGRLPHVLLADDDDVPEEYSLLQRQHAQAGPAYSVLTDDGPVLVAPNRHAAKAKAATAATPRPPPPRYVASPLRISSPALPASWGRPSAPSLNTRQTRLGMPPRPASSSDLALPLRHHTDDGDMNAEEVGRLML